MRIFIAPVLVALVIAGGCASKSASHSSRDEIPPEVRAAFSKPAPQASEKTISNATKFLNLLQGKNYNLAYSQLSPRFSSTLSEDEFIQAVENLHNQYGTPNNCVNNGSTVGYSTVDSENIIIESALFFCQFSISSGVTQPGLAKVTVEVGKSGESNGILKFVYIPQSNIQYQGSYPLNNK